MNTEQKNVHQTTDAEQAARLAGCLRAALEAMEREGTTRDAYPCDSVGNLATMMSVLDGRAFVDRFLRVLELGVRDGVVYGEEAFDPDAVMEAVGSPERFPDFRLAVRLHLASR